MPVTFLQAAGGAILLRYAIVLSQAGPKLILTHAWTASILIALALWLTDRSLLYPNLRSPLRAFPRVPATNVMAERPRGKTPLNWFRQFPDADAVVMREPLGRMILFPTSPEALRDIMSTNSYHWEKNPGIRAFLGRVIGFGLIMAEGEDHKKQRKALTPAFNIRHIRALGPLMADKTQVLVEQLEKEGGVVEFSHWASRLTLDIIGPAALSREFGTLTSDDDPVAEAFGELLDPSPELITFMVSNMFLPQWFATRLPVKANRLIRVHCSKLRTLCRTILNEKHDGLKQAEEGAEDDILKNIVQSGQFTDEEVIDQMLTFLAAGHETTASALTWSMYLLALHKDVQARLRAEVRGSGEVESMPILNGVCEEVFRLYPTVPLTIRQSMCDTIVAGIGVPKGTVALIVPYAINRHPKHWNGVKTSSADEKSPGLSEKLDCEEFWPERWLMDGRINKHGGTNSNFCETTFLHGPRSCIGKDFAKAELKYAIAGLVAKLDIDIADPEREVIAGGTVTTKPIGGLNLRMKKVA